MTVTDPLADLSAAAPETPPARGPRPVAGATNKPRRPAAGPRIGGGGQGGRPSTASLEAKVRGSIEKGCGWTIIGASVTGNEHLAYDAKVVAYNAPRIAKELIAQSKQFPVVAQVLESLYAVSEKGQPLAILAAVGLPMLVNHGVIPAAMFQVPGMAALMPPEDEVGPMPEPKVRQPRHRKTRRPAPPVPEPTAAEDQPEPEPDPEPEHAPADALPVAPPGRFT